MKILILHLSDLHLNNQEIDENQIIKMTNSLNRFSEIKKIIVICSGDITASAKAEEYINANKFFSILLRELKKNLNEVIPVFIVPGNHDLSLSDDENLRYKEIIEFYVADPDRRAVILSKEEDRFKEFKKFILEEPFKLFNKSIFYDKQELLIDDKTFKFNLINSSFFSSRNHNDKDFHYFDKHYLNSYKEKEYCYNIVVMHHTTQWLHEEVKNDFENVIIDNANIILYGHEHLSRMNEITTERIGKTIISAGGAYYNIDTQGETYFNVLILDTETDNISTYIAKNDLINNIFMYTDEIKSHISKNNKGLITQKEFTKSLLSTSYDMPLNNIFVFPELNETNSSVSVNNLKDFEKILIDEKIINITGQFNSGKSSLLRHLCFDLREKYVVLFIEAQSIHNENIDKCLRKAFENQYGEKKEDYEKFLQTTKKKKMVIFDDIDKIKISGKLEKSSLMAKLGEMFEFIIYSSFDEIEFDLKKEVKNELIAKTKTFKISPFYKVKRKCLIKKLLELLECGNCEDAMNKIEESIVKSAQNTNYTPDLIIQYTLFAQNKSQFEDVTSFNIVFETNITNKISKVNTSDTDEYLMILSAIAFSLHKKKRTMLTEEDIMELIKKYNYDFGGKIKLTDFLKNCMDAKIIYPINDLYEFIDKQTLAFFIARYLKDSFLNEDKYVEEEINYLLNNLCFGINSEIYLFVVYFLGYKQFVRVEDFANKLMHNWEEFSFAKKNIKMLYKKKSTLEIDAPLENAKIDSENNLHRIEKQTDSSYCLDYSDIYDYDESLVNDDIHKMMNALKYLEILSRGLPIYYAKTSREYKEIIIDSIYTKANKLIYKILKPIDDNFDEIVASLTEIVKNDDSEINVDVSNIVPRVALSMMIGIYSNLAVLMTTTKTIRALNDYVTEKAEKSPIDDSYKVFNLMMRILRGDSEAFINKADECFDKTNDFNVKSLVKLCIRNFVINNSSMNIALKDKVSEKYFTSTQVVFNENARANMLALRTQNEISKKKLINKS